MSSARRIAPRLFVCLCLFAVSTHRAAAAEPADSNPLVAQVLQAKGQFQPVTPEELAARKEQLQSAMTALDQYLSENQPDLAEPLKTHLKWAELQQQLQKDAPELSVLQSLGPLFVAAQEGLELPEVHRVRDAFVRYMDTVIVVSDKRIADAYPEQVELLATRLRQFAEDPSTENRLAIGRSLGWLEHTGQAVEAVRAVRSAFWQPNLYAEVSHKLISASVSQDVDEVERVRDHIMGTSIRGQARLSGEVSVELVPDPDRAVLDIFLAGQANSSNVGYNGPVKVYSTGWTSVWARKRVYVDAAGLEGDRAVADCSTDSRIDSISARCGLVRRMAWKKARQSQAQAERVASSHAEGRVARQFNAQVGEMLANANEQFTGRFRNPLLRRDAFPNALHLATTADRLTVQATRAGISQIAAPGPPPTVSGEFDLSVRVHDSLVGNIGESLMGGEKLTDESLLKMLEDAKIEVSEELKIGPNSEPWSVTFTRDQPLSVAFADNRVVISLQGREFTRGSQEIRDLIRISATYSAVPGDTGITLRREGDVAVDYVQRKSLGVDRVAMKTFLRRKFDAVFKSEVDPQKVKLPERWQRIGQVRLTNLQADKGWLTVGWKQAPPAEQPPVAETGG
jgi:hypothetical protein